MMLLKIQNAQAVRLNGMAHRTEQVYQSILEAILNGSLEPGTHLKVEILSSQLGVSSTPVRDALNRIAHDGLIIMVPYQGARVKRFTREEIRDLYEFRAGIESWAVRLCCQRIGRPEIDELVKCHVQSRQALKKKDMSSYMHYSQHVHTIILEASHNEHLLAAFSTVSLQIKYLSNLGTSVANLLRRSIREHEDFIAAIKKKDSDKAAVLIEKHIMNAGEDILAFFDSIGKPFNLIVQE